MGKLNKEIVVYNSSEIKKKIYTIRGEQVILDKDLAELYQVKAIRLREQVKRNINRFPSEFMFQLTEIESEFMVSQNAIPSKQHLGGTLPYVFTEQGVAMLSAVLKSETAVKMSIQIMSAFVTMRKFLVENAGVFQRLDSLEIKQIETDQKVTQIFDAMQSNELPPKQGIFYYGQVFDAYKFVSSLIRKANKAIIIIDNYIDETVLDLLAKKKDGVEITIFTKSISKTLKLDEKKFVEQYGNLTIKQFNKSHDRFLIIDDKDIYHFGASLKDLGKKWFAFQKFEKESFALLERIKEGAKN